jgi:DNA invertase Pin-like site-specific DNA recombinase
MKTNNNKALIYCRVSTKKQEREGSGLSSQEKRCREYAAFNGYEVEKVFQDSFSGGGDFMKRPAMRDLIDYVDNKVHDGYVVIFDDLKRFARDLKFHWELREAFRLRKLTPFCLNFTFEETPEGSFIETIIAAQGELEREQNKRQVVQKMKARMDRGIYCMGGNAPFGYDFKKNNTYGGKVLEVNENDAEIAREAFLGFASSKLFHIKDVAHYINSHEHYKRKEKMRVESVRRMLSNILYTGYVEYLPWDIKRLKGIHQAIIPLSTFDEVQERIFGKVPQRTRIDVRDDFPLRGFVNCENCNRPLTAAMSTSGTGKKHPYYRCYLRTCPLRYKGKAI